MDTERGGRRIFLPRLKFKKCQEKIQKKTIPIDLILIVITKTALLHPYLLRVIRLRLLVQYLNFILKILKSSFDKNASF